MYLRIELISASAQRLLNRTLVLDSMRDHPADRALQGSPCKNQVIINLPTLQVGTEFIEKVHTLADEADRETTEWAKKKSHSMTMSMRRDL